MQKSSRKSQRKIAKIEITKDKISGRGGLEFFLRYVEQIGFYQLAEKILGHIQVSSKGLSLYRFTKQMLACFIDGTYMSMESFNDRKKDSGYSAVLENQAEEMSSSHQMKRFFRKLMDNNIGNTIYRTFLHKLFLWRLQIEKPEIIILGADTMVMDNNDAHKREGVEPTYKKRKAISRFILAGIHIWWISYFEAAVVIQTMGQIS